VLHGRLFALALRGAPECSDCFTEQAAKIGHFGFCRRTGDGDGERHAQSECYGDEYANSGEPRPDNGHRAHGALAPAKMSLDSTEEHEPRGDASCQSTNVAGARLLNAARLAAAQA
jgi:hypothetical protein